MWQWIVRCQSVKEFLRVVVMRIVHYIVKTIVHHIVPLETTYHLHVNHINTIVPRIDNIGHEVM